MPSANSNGRFQLFATCAWITAREHSTPSAWKPRDHRVTLGLFPASLEDKPYYEAISYSWGDANKRKEIRCDNYSVTVPENLYDALRHLRYTDRVRTLWVDAICINQVQIGYCYQIFRLLSLLLRSSPEFVGTVEIVFLSESGPLRLVSQRAGT